MRLVSFSRESTGASSCRAAACCAPGTAWQDGAVEPLRIDSSGRTLSAHVSAPAVRRPGLLFIHGLHSNQSGYLERAKAATERLGAVCLAFDLSGHGESDGAVSALSLRDHLGDVIAAYDRLVAERDVDTGRIGVAGASYGGYLAALLTARRPVARLAMRAPVVYVDSELSVPLALRTGGRGLPEESRAFDALRRFSGTVLLVESERDEVVPATTIQAYRDAVAEAEYVLIPDAGHELNRPEWRKAFLDALLAFFREL
jgi:pimeloyl-ACP methyl ester carboxylesterase